jgi:hypothetical protein
MPLVPHQVDILQHLGASLNVAYCYGAYEQPQCVGIVMELLSGGELWSRIRKGHYSEAGDPVPDRHDSSGHIACALSVAIQLKALQCRLCRPTDLTKKALATNWPLLYSLTRYYFSCPLPLPHKS